MCEFCGRQFDDVQIDKLKGALPNNSTGSGNSNALQVTAMVIGDMADTDAGWHLKASGMKFPRADDEAGEQALTGADAFDFGSFAEGTGGETAISWMQDELTNGGADKMPPMASQSDAAPTNDFWTHLSVESFDDWLA